MPLSVIYALIIATAIVANTGAAVADFTGAKFASDNSARIGIPRSWLPALGMLKVAGAAGLMLGLLGVPYVDIAAAIGLVLFFLGAIGVHLRAREHRHIITTAGYFLVATASLVASVTR